MKNLLWVDTCFFYALFVHADCNHSRANASWQSNLRERKNLVTSNLVMNELGTLLAYRFGHAIAFRQLTLMHDSSVLFKVYSSEEIETQALLWWRRFKDQKFSFVDCVSFECMHRLGIREALTFDKDFVIAGFTPGL